MIVLMIPRTCPGKQFALRTVYLVVACVLSAFDIGPALDEDGNPQMPKAEFHCVTVRYVFLASLILVVVVLTAVRRHARDPKPFKCTIKPRSEGVIKLVKEACDRTSC